MENPLDLDAYLTRIGYHGPLAATETCLAGLHEAHVGAIPFENLDVLRGETIALDLPSLMAKLVHARRGGYCFEHGMLFKAVLDRIGFGTHILTARVRLDGTRVAPRSHMLLKVDTREGAFLADVGFGGFGLLRPIPLLPDVVTHVPGAAYRLRHEHGLWVLEGDVGDDNFSDYYAFTLEAQYPVDIEVANHYVATHPSSIFRRTLTAQLTRADRRVVLRNLRLEIHQGDERHTIELPDEAALVATLEKEFGLAVPNGMRLTLPDN
ncbi:MAG TPA: arylamine N-acetyltransferase [Aliidongia sp.]|nr:arylamine N-acetyltransferase [Aliidongia sp.]